MNGQKDFTLEECYNLAGRKFPFDVEFRDPAIGARVIKVLKKKNNGLWVVDDGPALAIEWSPLDSRNYYHLVSTGQQQSGTPTTSTGGSTIPNPHHHTLTPKLQTLWECYEQNGKQVPFTVDDYEPGQNGAAATSTGDQFRVSKVHSDPVRNGIDYTLEHVGHGFTHFFSEMYGQEDARYTLVVNQGVPRGATANASAIAREEEKKIVVKGQFKSTCTCEIVRLLAQGCTCGAIERYRA